MAAALAKVTATLFVVPLLEVLFFPPEDCLLTLLKALRAFFEHAA